MKDNLIKKLFFIFLIFSLVYSQNVSFISPKNNSLLCENYTINTSITTNNLTQLNFTLNNKTYSIYDEKLMMYLNLDNNTEIGETNTYIVSNTNMFNCSNSVLYYTDGVYGKALNLTGTYSVDCGPNTITSTGEFTIEAWIRNFQTNNYKIAVFIGNASSSRGAWIGYATATVNPSSFSIGGGFYGRNYGSGVTGSDWHHVVLTAKGSGNNVSLYVDGVLKYSENFAYYLGNQRIKLGADSSGGYSFNGFVDDVKIYNRSITPEEVYIHYISTLKKYNSTKWSYLVGLNISSCNIFNVSILAPDYETTETLTECGYSLEENNECYSSCCYNTNLALNSSYCQKVKLNNSIYIENSTCIVFNQNSKELNCQNYLISGNNNSTSYGIVLNESINNNINNCNISNFNIGISLFSTSNISINNISASNIETQIYLVNTTNTSIKDLKSNLSSEFSSSSMFSSLSNIVSIDNATGKIIFSSSNNILIKNSNISHLNMIANCTDVLIFNNIFSTYYFENVFNISFNTSKTCNETNIIGGPCIGGNFWEEYEKIDYDFDGIGDEKFEIEIHNENIEILYDFLPLTNKRLQPLSIEIKGKKVIYNTLIDNPENCSITINDGVQIQTYYPNNFPYFIYLDEGKYYTTFTCFFNIQTRTEKYFIIKEVDFMIEILEIFSVICFVYSIKKSIEYKIASIGIIGITSIILNELSSLSEFTLTVITLLNTGFAIILLILIIEEILLSTREKK